MKRISLVLLALCLYNVVAYAHVINYTKGILHHWSIPAEHVAVDGSFYMMKEGKVFIEKENYDVVAYPLGNLSKEDQAYAMEKHQLIKQLNKELMAARPKAAPVVATDNYKLLLPGSLAVICLLAIIYLFSGTGIKFIPTPRLKYAYPILMAGMISALFGFNRVYRTTSVSDPVAIDSAFAPYGSLVTTSWDSNYFYVASYGIPTQPAQQMMAGITNWNQQVPIPQCYTGNNSWSIPLNPVLAATPVPTATNFFRGAIAVAVNGVPIFNALTNTGEDAYLTGQLDSFGGHAGRADDYHYHIAPLILQATSGTKPIAFALDGFAVYGSREPNGSPMAALDTNHGHFWSGVYHYHGTMTYPYMIGNMVGKVTEDTTSQIVPQAASTPVRIGQAPLPGAVILSCTQSGVNGFKLSYSYSGHTDSIIYSWDATGVYNYIFKNLIVGTADSTYNGFKPCYFLPATANVGVANMQGIVPGLYITPNPSDGHFTVRVASPANEDARITITDMYGKRLRSFDLPINTEQQIKLTLPAGVYIVSGIIRSETFAARLVIE